jgi:MFS superfamily sulfate permease-like transporter
MRSPSLPGARMVAGYRIEWLRSDVVAGLVLSTLLVPQGMAYAELAGLPAITGLYTTILCLIGYAVFGPSRLLVLGPDSSLGPMIAATLLPILGSNGSPERAIALASMLALIVGALMIAAGVAKLGFVADLLSKPTQIGYMNGLALTILIGQLPKLFGFSTDANGLIHEAQAFVHGLASGEAVGAAVAVGVLSLALILVLARWLPRVPGVLVAVVVAIAVSAALDLGSHGVSLVGTLPKGFPPLTVPSPISDLPLLVAGALGIVLVALTDTISTASAFAARTGQEVDGNGEMIGIGAANVAAGLFQGFPVSTSGSRTAVAEQAGAKTQVTGLVGAALIVLMLVLVPGLLKSLPNPSSPRWSSRRRCRSRTSPGRCACGISAGSSSCSRSPPFSELRCSACSRASRSRSRSRSSTCSGGHGGLTRQPSGTSPGCPASTTSGSTRRPSNSPDW